MLNPYLESARIMLHQVRDTADARNAIIWFYSALSKFKSAGLSLEEIMAEVESVEPDWIAKWRQKYT